MRAFSITIASSLLCAVAVRGAAAAPLASPAPIAVPSPEASGNATPVREAPQVDPEVTTRAEEWLRRLQSGKIDRSQLDSYMNMMFTTPLVQRAQTDYGPLGPPLAFTFTGAQHEHGKTGYTYRVRFKDDTVLFYFGLDDGGKVSGLLLKPLP